VAGTARKAWRLVGEMEELAASFAVAGVPEQFHEAGASTEAIAPLLWAKRLGLSGPTR
jgi:hypothetical protein